MYLFERVSIITYPLLFTLSRPKRPVKRKWERNKHIIQKACFMCNDVKRTVMCLLIFHFYPDKTTLDPNWNMLVSLLRVSFKLRTCIKDINKQEFQFSFSFFFFVILASKMIFLCLSGWNIKRKRIIKISSKLCVWS